MKLHFKFRTGPYAVSIWELLWSLKLVIFSAAFAAVVATVLKINPYISNVRVLSLCIFLWDVTLEERKSFNPCIND